MRSFPLLAALAVMAAAAGCTTPDESAAQERTRGLTALMPEDATKLFVDITHTALGTSDVSVVVDANGTILAQGEFDATGESRDFALEADTAGAQLVGVTITARGDVTLHVVLSAVRADGSRETLRDEWMTVA